MFGWINYLRKNKLLARVEELEDRVDLLQARIVRRENAENMRTLRGKTAVNSLAEDAAKILTDAEALRGSTVGNSTSGRSLGRQSKLDLYKEH